MNEAKMTLKAKPFPLTLSVDCPIVCVIPLDYIVASKGFATKFTIAQGT
jgi:hypothetical protein